MVRVFKAIQEIVRRFRARQSNARLLVNCLHGGVPVTVSRVGNVESRDFYYRYIQLYLGGRSRVPIGIRLTSHDLERAVRRLSRQLSYQERHHLSLQLHTTFDSVLPGYVLDELDDRLELDDDYVEPAAPPVATDIWLQQPVLAQKSG